MPPKTAYHDALGDYFAEHAGISPYNAYTDRPAMLELAGDVAGARILDVGCGAGHYATELLARGAEVVGVDGSATLLDHARAPHLRSPACPENAGLLRSGARPRLRRPARTVPASEGFSYGEQAQRTGSGRFSISGKEGDGPRPVLRRAGSTAGAVERRRVGVPADLRPCQVPPRPKQRRRRTSPDPGQSRSAGTPTRLRGHPGQPGRVGPGGNPGRVAPGKTGRVAPGKTGRVAPGKTGRVGTSACGTPVQARGSDGYGVGSWEVQSVPSATTVSS
ncbi:hypothetical protein GCM10012289_54630 [Nonomuraea cavernae]|uniref:Methyltransferase domain-containing protein n=2 Tax=Nonomuraea cavernae TaxID=2045107 RepID=A0A918DQ53_9ACTN|nr:hypothetical protein GCM10012289_54630 [Nonomuraea cavernae]